jgi:7,8-dihydropterin-6-yl-methyl-4-(beta-D-ribofuranosyl)aminobenzene 5'-phosphate synthase
VVLVVGCSHPGIERIVEAAAAINPKIYLIAGGFHLVAASDEIIRKGLQGRKRCAGALHGRANVRSVEESFR